MADIDDDLDDAYDEDADGTYGAPADVQDAIDRIIDCIHATPPGEPDEHDLNVLSAWFDQEGTFFQYGDYGRYVPRHLVESYEPDDDWPFDSIVPADRQEELAEGAEPTEQELALWREHRASEYLDDPERHELPLYHFGSIESRDGRSARWLAAVTGFVDPFLSGRLVGIARSEDELLARLKEEEDVFALRHIGSV